MTKASSFLLLAVAACALATSRAATCGWDIENERCAITLDALGDGKNSTMAYFSKIAEACGLIEATADCTGNCTWDSDDKDCSVSGALVTRVKAADDGTFQAFLTIGETCAKTMTETACNAMDTCDWSAGEDECTVSNGEMVRAMLGRTSSDSEVAAIRVASRKCRALSTETTCTADSECEWDKDDKACAPSQHMMADKVGLGAISTTCKGGRTKTLCTAADATAALAMKARSIISPAPARPVAIGAGLAVAAATFLAAVSL